MSTQISPYTITIYAVFDGHEITESGVGAIFESRPGEVFPLSIPEDPRYLGPSLWLLTKHGDYTVRVRGSYVSPLEISRGPVCLRALQHLGELIDAGIADYEEDGNDD